MGLIFMKKMAFLLKFEIIKYNVFLAPVAPSTGENPSTGMIFAHTQSLQYRGNYRYRECLLKLKVSGYRKIDRGNRIENVLFVSNLFFGQFKRWL